MNKCTISICMYLLPFILYRFWIDFFLLSYRVYRCFSISNILNTVVALPFFYSLFPFVLLSTKDFGKVFVLSLSLLLVHSLHFMKRKKVYFYIKNTFSVDIDTDVSIANYQINKLQMEKERSMNVCDCFISKTTQSINCKKFFFLFYWTNQFEFSWRKLSVLATEEKWETLCCWTAHVIVVYQSP